MSHLTRKPSVQLSLDKGAFNKLISILDFNIDIDIEEGTFSKSAEKLKNKLLKYSVPRIDDNNLDFIDVRFFPNEASDMIWQLLVLTEKKENNIDYYSELIKNRENK